MFFSGRILVKNVIFWPDFDENLCGRRSGRARSDFDDETARNPDLRTDFDPNHKNQNLKIKKQINNKYIY